MPQIEEKYFTLFGIKSLEFILQHENGTPQASRDPRICDVQLK